jgi:hypothetical protein
LLLAAAFSKIIANGGRPLKGGSREKTVIPQMLKQKYGRIINISINLETMKRIGFTPYGPSKAAPESLNIIKLLQIHSTLNYTR